MTDPRTKKAREAGELSETTKSYLQEWFIEQQFGRKREFSNKFTEKGIEVEDEAIDLYSEVSDRPFLKKNEDHYDNEYCTGTPDVITDIVVDVKSSWDVFTFPMFGEEVDNKLYWWQLQGYMWLTDKNQAELAYCLVDTPPELIHKEMNRVQWNSVGTLTEEQEAVLQDELEKNMTFSDIPKNLRVKTFLVERDNEAIDRIKARVIECREYVSLLSKTIK